MKLPYLALCLINVFLLSPLTRVAAQRIETTWGEGVKRSEFGSTPGMNWGVYTYMNFLGDEGEYYYALKSQVEDAQFKKSRDYFFEKYDLAHRLVKSSKMSLLTPEGKTGTYENTYRIGNSNVLFFTYHNSKLDANLLYATRIDNDGKQGTAFLVDKQFERQYIAGKYVFVQPAGKNDLLIIRLDGYDKKITRNLKYTMMNSELKTTWEKEFPITSKDMDFAIRQCIVDKTGNVFLLDAFTPDDGEKSLHYSVIAYNSVSGILKEVNIGYSDNELDNVRIFPNNGHVAMVGFHYQEKGVVTGLFSGKLNSATFEMESQKVELFHADTVRKYFSKEAQKRAMGVKPIYTITDVIVRKNGAFQLVTENRAVQQIREEVGNNSYNSIFYAFIELMIIQVDENGKIEWTADIPKYQHGIGDYSKYGSYLMDYDDEHVYFLYNDNPKNILLNSKKNWRDDKGLIEELNLNKAGKGGLMKAAVTNDGKVNRELYVDKEGKNNTIIKPFDAKRTGKDSFWVIGESGNMVKFGFVKFR